MAGRINLKELRKLTNGFMASRVILTANNLDLFSHLKRAQDCESLVRALGTDPRATRLLLDALVSLGLLRKQAKKYRNASIATQCLVPDAPEYQGDILRHIDNMWDNWSALDEVMSTGRPAGRAFDHHAFIMGMQNLSALRVKEVARAMRLKDVRKVLDLGCGPGVYALEMARRGISVTMFDLPDTIKIAKKIAAQHKIKGIRFIEGNYFTDNLGVGYDLIFLSHILHANSSEDNMALLKRCSAALNPAGRIVVQEFYLNRERVHPPRGTLFAINMLVQTEGGRCYSPEEMMGWFKELGFEHMAKKQLTESVLVEAMKPSLRPVRWKQGSG